MRANNYIVVSLLGAMALVSCLREADSGIPEGMLRANIVQPDSDTRTSFDGGTGKFRWSEGDKIAIHMSTGYFTEAEVDYRTGFFECPTTESRYRNYYAVYPASIAVEDAYGNPDLDVVLPATYDISEKLTSDYSPLPMIAVNREAESDLYFNHAGGLIRIILNDVAAEAAQARVTFEHNVTGIFRVHWASEKLPYISDGGDGAVVTFQLAESTLGEVTNGIRLNVPVPTGHYGEVKIEVLGSDNAVITSFFGNLDWDCTRSHGKLVDFEVAEYTFSLYSSSWNISSSSKGPNAYYGLKSYRSSYLDGSQTVVPWKVEGYYSDRDCTIPYDGEDAGNAPSWFVSLGDNGTGPGSVDFENVPFNVNKMRIKSTVDVYSSAAQTINARIEASSFGAGSSPMNYYNLSNPADKTSDYIAESANCYIVNGPGYYCIPLVMGNGIIDNAFNPDERTYKGIPGRDYWIPFQDYKGQTPVDPYIHKTSSLAGTPTSAFIVWEDDSDLIELANMDDYSLAGVPLVLKNDVWWLQFHVVKPVQGNAIIAVADEEGVIMWSWHIWQTDYVPENYGGETDILITANDPSHKYRMMPYTLGWVESGLRRTYTYEGDTVYILIRQAESRLTKTIRFNRTGESEEFSRGNYAPYYQWGRKEPICPSDGLHSLRYYATLWYGRQSVIYTISPGYHELHVGIRWPSGYMLTEPYAYNLWSAGRKKYGFDYDETIKTAYDPCPAGYCVPPSMAFSGFSLTGANGGVDDMNLAEDAGDRLYFYTDNSRTETICFPLLGGMDRGYQNINEVGYYLMSSYASFTQFERSYIGFYYYSFGGYSVRPVVENKEVFGGSGSGSGATTTGVEVNVHDMGGYIWEE